VNAFALGECCVAQTAPRTRLDQGRPLCRAASSRLRSLRHAPTLAAGSARRIHAACGRFTLRTRSQPSFGPGSVLRGERRMQRTSRLDSQSRGKQVTKRGLLRKRHHVRNIAQPL
jgi:hypothetical protein